MEKRLKPTAKEGKDNTKVKKREGESRQGG
jgi:hypothetical protein